jgi:broad-specificity NMP kinase
MSILNVIENEAIELYDSDVGSTIIFVAPNQLTKEHPEILLSNCLDFVLDHAADTVKSLFDLATILQQDPSEFILSLSERAMSDVSDNSNVISELPDFSEYAAGTLEEPSPFRGFI